VVNRAGHAIPVPRIVGKIRRNYPVEVDDLKFLRQHTKRLVKITVPGPFTMSQQAQNDFYPTLADAAMGYAQAVKEEIADLFAAGADIVQLDEPYLQAQPEAAEEYGLAALNAALEGAAVQPRFTCALATRPLLTNDPTATRSCRNLKVAAVSRSQLKPRNRTWIPRCLKICVAKPLFSVCLIYPT